MSLLLSTVKRRKLSEFGRVCRHDTMQKITLEEPVDGSRRRGRPRGYFMEGQHQVIYRPVDVVISAHLG